MSRTIRTVPPSWKIGRGRCYTHMDEEWFARVARGLICVPVRAAQKDGMPEHGEVWKPETKRFCKRLRVRAARRHARAIIAAESKEAE